MSQIYDQFQKTFIQQVFTPVDYKVTKYSDDFVNKYINEYNWLWKRENVQMEINQIDDRLTQTYVLAGLWLKQHQYGSWMKELPVFKDMEFLKNISDLIKNSPEQPDENDLDLESLTEDDIDFTEAVASISIDTGLLL